MGGCDGEDDSGSVMVTMIVGECDDDSGKI